MGALLTLVNEAADAVAKDRPGVFVGTLAYQFSRTPPKSLKPRPNVAIQLCSIEACQIHPLNDPDCPKNVGLLQGPGRLVQDLRARLRLELQHQLHQLQLPLPQPRGDRPQRAVPGGARGQRRVHAGARQRPEHRALRAAELPDLATPVGPDARRPQGHRRVRHALLRQGRRQGPRLPDAHRRDRPAIGQSTRTASARRPATGSTPTVARKAIGMLEEGMAAAENDEVRRRVEKVSIGAHGPHRAIREVGPRPPAARSPRRPRPRHRRPPTPGSRTNCARVFRLYERTEWIGSRSGSRCPPRGPGPASLLGG